MVTPSLTSDRELGLAARQRRILRRLAQFSDRSVGGTSSTPNTGTTSSTSSTASTSPGRVSLRRRLRRGVRNVAGRIARRFGS